MSIRPQGRRTQTRWSNVVHRHPLMTFFVLTYAAAWSLWMPLVFFRDGMPGALTFALVLLGSLVPSAVAILLIGILHGRGGVRKLLRRLLMWRVGLRWYVVVLTVPMLVPLGLGMSVLFGGSSPVVEASIVSVMAMFVFSVFPGSALGEELGWRGFALPHLQADRSALGASVVLGAIWGFYHLPLWLIGTESHPPVLFPAFAASVIAMSVILTWMYNSTGGSLLIVVLLHASSNLPLTILLTPLGGRMAQSFLISVALLGIVAMAVAAATGTANLSRTQPKQVEAP